MKIKEIKSSLLLFLAAVIWGVAFVAQSVGLDYVGPMTLNGSRFLLGGAVLLPLIYFRQKRQGEEAGKEKKQWKTTLLGGLGCGLALCIASSLQQYGIQ